MHKSVLNCINIDELLFNPLFQEIDFWCDYLTLSYKNSVDYLDKLLFWIDIDNSNFALIEFEWKEFTYIKHLTSLWYALTFSYVYNWSSFPLFQYVKFNNQTRQFTKRKWKLSIYWSYFRLEEVWEFRPAYIIDLVKTFSDEDPFISRYDFRLDRFSSEDVAIPEVEDVCQYSNQSRVLVWREWKTLIDWSVWSKDTDRYFIRYYDKKIDTDKKNKRILYSDFVKYKSVHRFEIEFLVQFCRGYHLSNLFELEDKIYSVLHLKDFEYQDAIFYKYDSECEITPENAWKFIDRYMNLSKKLIKAWYSPYQIIEEMVVWTFWKDVAIWLLEDFLSHSLVYRWSQVKGY